MKTKAAPLKLAISVATSQAKLAAAITAAGRRCTQQTISYWLKELDGEIPAEWCPYIESATGIARARLRSEEHTSELQSLMRISYAVFCLKQKHRITLRKPTEITKKH